MPGIINLTFKPPFRDIAGRFAKANQQLLEDRREMVRTLGRRYVELAKEEAPKKSGEFAKGHLFRTFIQGDRIGFNAYSPQPLGTFIIRGTATHHIAANAASALYFFWPKVGMFTVVPKSGGFATHVSDGKLWVGKGYVSHPGTKPNEYTRRAYDRWKPEARPALRQIALRYVATIQG
jgi:hypothetical protein